MYEILQCFLLKTNYVSSTLHLFANDFERCCAYLTMVVTCLGLEAWKLFDSIHFSDFGALENYEAINISYVADVIYSR